MSIVFIIIDFSFLFFVVPSFPDWQELHDDRVFTLPYSIRVLLESAVRNCDEFEVKKSDVENILNWNETSLKETEIPFKPSRVLLQDFTYVCLPNVKTQS